MLVGTDVDSDGSLDTVSTMTYYDLYSTYPFKEWL